ncbi:MAG: hypothetical protein QXD43_02605 [Candidatus Aenigmatarchaeota archaeon]
MTKLPKFEGRPLIEIPKSIPSINFLGGDFGKAVLQEYKQIAETDYKGADALDVLSYHNDVIEGSNPFAVVLVNKIVEKEGLRTATPADLERAIRLNKVNQQLGLNLRGTYEDTALVLRSESEPNEYLAKNLAKQIKARQNIKFPVMVPLNGLDLVNDSNSEYDLSFKLKENTQVIHAPILNKSGYFTSEMVDEQTGLPKQTCENGDRYLYTRDSGLSGLYLYGDLYLDSCWGGLAYSDSGGRVVVVSDALKNTLQKSTKQISRKQ